MHCKGNFIYKTRESGFQHILLKWNALLALKKNGLPSRDEVNSVEKFPK